MKTDHRIIFENSNCMEDITANSIALVVTSPPYPMIEMWDDLFCNQNNEIKKALEYKEGHLAFELMNKELDKIWKEVYRVLIDGGIACINIGDATRKIGKDFQLYSNHSRIQSICMSLGFQTLPCILWRKPTNAPNKFMGSGMLPPGAYVTLEHEYILILRKGGKREFKSDKDKENRRESAFFWEERNHWFSDLWVDVRGIGQKIKKENDELRSRSAAYPFDLAYRLINMFSVKNDIILDPFFGTGTTTQAAMISRRNSIGYELNSNFNHIISEKLLGTKKLAKKIIDTRLENHTRFVKLRTEEKGELKYINNFYSFPIMTKQEKELRFDRIQSIKKVSEEKYEVTYHTDS